MRYWIMGLCLLGVACNQPAKPDETPIEVSMLKAEVVTLTDRVSRLEKRQPADYAFLKPSQKTWVWLWNGAYSLRVGIKDVKASGNGSKLVLTVQNPLAVDLHDCTASILWGEVDSEGTPVESTKHEDDFSMDASLPAGKFEWPEFDLSDIPPSKLGFVTVKGIDCTRTG